jgi:ABC-type branched-subunit amino acid transport system substrate-binding protein
MWRASIRNCIRIAAAATALSALLVAPLVKAAELTPQELRGKRIYAEGESVAGTPLTALFAKGSTPIPASIVPCGSCHGADGRGRPEGGVVPPDITWSALTNSYGHEHDYGRSHPAFDDTSFERAVLFGLDPAGNEFDSTMPRYSMPGSDLADLVAYVKRLETDLDTGLTEDEIRIGTVLPMAGPLASLGETMKKVLEAYFTDINANGGINGRKLELVVAEYDADPTYAGWRVRDLVEQQDVFALVSGYLDGIEKDVAELVEEFELPIVGPFTMLPEEGAGLNRYSFYLLSGISHHAELLIRFAATVPGTRGSHAAIVHRAAGPYVKFAGMASAAARPGDWSALETVSYTPSDFDATKLADELKESGAESLFFFGSAEELKSLTTAADRNVWTPLVFVPGSLASRTMFEIPVSFAGKVYLAYPSVPGDHTPKGVEEFERFHAQHEINYRHSAAQISAYTAAMILAEGLKRAGRDLSRERVVQELEGLTDFRTGLMPPISYNSRRRVGALGGYVLTLDPAARKLSPTGNWIGLNH